jgi:hypothetical protein
MLLLLLMKSHKLFFPGALPLAASRGPRIYMYVCMHFQLGSLQGPKMTMLYSLSINSFVWQR